MNGWAWQATSIAEQVGSSVTFVGNLLALIIFLWSKRLRIKYYAFVINLVIANLSDPILTFIYQYYDNDILLALLRTGLFVAELNLLAIAVNRLLALSITPPARYDSLVTSGRLFVVCILLWLISAAIYLPSTYVYNQVVIRLVRPLITLTILLVTAVLYYIVFLKISRYTPPLASTPPLKDADEVTRTRMRQTRYMMVTVTIILVSSLICWLPFCCANFYIYFSGKYYGRHTEEFKIMYTAFILLLMVNSAINPFIYWWRIAEFRDGLKRVVCCHCIRRQNPDEDDPELELYGGDNLGNTINSTINSNM
ncbi:adenosine receptor A2a-like [Patiria miniata]|uniref:G-protein coupled receptors family 1 profile domain-containing protein n=1 Tax=Patiria miniata TaxID=46514 RepID=A0A914AMA7_PATMI|nr:adenosine receptor A2a-like [Patiria miniata]